mgnify:CR=1 FL=1
MPVDAARRVPAAGGAPRGHLRQRAPCMMTHLLPTARLSFRTPILGPTVQTRLRKNFNPLFSCHRWEPRPRPRTLGGGPEALTPAHAPQAVWNSTPRALPPQRRPRQGAPGSAQSLGASFGSRLQLTKAAAGAPSPSGSAAHEWLRGRALRTSWSAHWPVRRGAARDFNPQNTLALTAIAPAGVRHPTGRRAQLSPPSIRLERCSLTRPKKTCQHGIGTRARPKTPLRAATASNTILAPLEHVPHLATSVIRKGRWARVRAWPLGGGVWNSPAQP